MFTILNSIKLCKEDVLDVLKNAQEQFPLASFRHKFPPIVMRHQLYSIIGCPTAVDRITEELRQAGILLKFKHSEGGDEWALVLRSGRLF